jgi:HEAT repeat protein
MKEITPHITALLNSTVQKRVAAATALGKSDNPFAIPPLIQSLSDPHWKVRLESAQALGRLGDGDAVTALVSALRDPEPVVRTAVIAAIGRIRDRRATGALISCLKDTDERVRIGAAEVLGKLGDPRAIEPLGGARTGSSLGCTGCCRECSRTAHEKKKFLPVIPFFLERGYRTRPPSLFFLSLTCYTVAIQK